MNRMSKELEQALSGIKDPELKARIEAEWREYADQNKYYEESFYPEQAENMAEFDVKLQDGKTLETPQEQMERFNHEIMAKIDELKSDKEKGKEPEIDKDISEDKETPQHEQSKQEHKTNREDIFRLSFDDRDIAPQQPQAREQTPQMSKTGKAPSADDKMHWGVTWERMPEPLQEAISSVKDDFLREELRTEWKELSEQNRHYERSAYPRQVESVVDYNRTFKANIAIETPPDQMRRYNGIIMDKVAEINGEKEKGREQTYELDEQENVSSNPAPAKEEEKTFRLSFDDRHLYDDHTPETTQPEKDLSKEDIEMEQDMDDLEYER